MDEDLPPDRGEGLVRERVGDWILVDQPNLGPPKVTDSSVGRGADGWIPAIEWAGQAAATGVMGGIAWAITVVAAREAKALIERFRSTSEDGDPEETPKFEETPKLYVSRGMAAHLAVDHVAQDEDGPLVVEAVEEPSSLRGESTHELNYVGIEPWLVIARDQEYTTRHYVVICPTGQPLASMVTPIGRWERFFAGGELDDDYQGE